MFDLGICGEAGGLVSEVHAPPAYLRLVLKARVGSSISN